MTQRTINPQLIKAAAGMAIPGKEWFVRRVYGPTGPDTYTDFIQCADGSQFTTFNPLQNDGDALKLMLALMEQKNGDWVFTKSERSQKLATFRGCDVSFKARWILEDSFALLLYKALASQTNIPMFAEVV